MSDITALLVAVYIGIGLILAATLLGYVKVPTGAGIGYRFRRLFLSVFIAATWPAAMILVFLWLRTPYRHVIARFVFGKRDDKDDEDDD